MRAFVICAVVACGSDRSAAPPPPSDLIIAIDQEGAKPATYRAIPVGEHTTEQRRADGDPTSSTKGVGTWSS